MLDELRTFHLSLKKLRSEIKKEEGNRISKSALKNSSERLAMEWFSTISVTLAAHPIVSSEVIEQYTVMFRTLLRLPKANNLRTSYLTVLNGILKSLHEDLILPIQTEPRLSKSVSELEKMLAGLSHAEESAYLKEASDCARAGFLRAAAVLGWCAGIDRIHHCIEKLGFDKFNLASRQMTAATAGRFKRFNSPANVGSLSELREVFDSNILWILEGMSLIDGNQHTRLRSCFELRCQSGHPGDAPVTEYNLLSFFSDIDQIILRNPTFQR